MRGKAASWEDRLRSGTLEFAIQTLVALETYQAKSVRVPDFCAHNYGLPWLWPATAPPGPGLCFSLPPLFQCIIPVHGCVNRQFRLPVIGASGNAPGSYRL